MSRALELVLSRQLGHATFHPLQGHGKGVQLGMPPEPVVRHVEVHAGRLVAELRLQWGLLVENARIISFLESSMSCVARCVEYYKF